MKARVSSFKSMVKQSARAGVLLIIVAALTLEATAILQYVFSKKAIYEEAAQRAESQLETTRVRILDIVNQAEAAVRNSIWIAVWCLEVPDSLHVVARRIVEDNPVVVGSTLALVPGYNKRFPLYAPYACREGDKIVLKSLASKEYDYPNQEWFTQPIELGKGYWSEPYVDEGGGEILMTTYSVPIFDAKGRPAAVLTADISLEWLSEMISSLQEYPHSYGVVLSRGGQTMVGPEEELPEGTKVQEFKAQVDSTDWLMSIVIPNDEIYAGIRSVGLLVKILQLLGIGMLVLILRAVARSQLKYMALNEKKELMENELRIGRNIQQSMIPHIFPPFPERKDLDMSACLVPAKEVGGDLFDFYIRDEKLHFCIGDVSGKGVPASLVMAVTRSLFRTVSAHEDSAGRIVTTMNNSMADMNESNMFVTFFCGILDLKTGHLSFCNAGHNPPMIITDNIRILEVQPNLPLGIMQGMTFVEQEANLKYDDALFLYTDGLTEAENNEHELFGEQRVDKVLRTRRDSQGHLDAMKEAVAAFVGDAPQSDDLTMLFIHYLHEGGPETEERHLVLHNDIAQIPQLAGFMEKIEREKNLDQSLTMSLNLALEEAVTNVILYAYPEGADGLVDIEAILSRDRLKFIISDSGKPFDPTSAPEADINASVEQRPIGGLGIHLVRSIMDSVEYVRENEKNILTMIKNI